MPGTWSTVFSNYRRETPYSTREPVFSSNFAESRAPPPITTLNMLSFALAP
ncbi:predicted protein [Botrytis cinerea T4]|uniref:Uncharacterized protein n=1 Tax=Botryotinia fuckeliana (strain T4) TaxID=999810 RepID=G2Y2P2_BOTF4|nr:predicted protein [Botrytis cinerea T4]